MTSQKLRDLRDALAENVDEAARVERELERDDLKASELRDLKKRLDAVTAEGDKLRKMADRERAICEARALIPPDTTPMPGDAFRGWSGDNFATGGGNYATARGSLRHEYTYRPDGGTSFFRDLTTAQRGDQEARMRLHRNHDEAADFHAGRLGVSMRDMGDSAAAGGEFVPVLYLPEQWVSPSISRRPLADALPGLPLPPQGTSISIPQLSSGVSVAARASGGTVSETDGITSEITHDVNEIAGLTDVDRIAVMRSDPGLDLVIEQTLQRRHDAYLDSQLISGSGTAPEHRGIRNVSGVNSVTFTAGTPTAAGLLAKLGDAIQKVASERSGEVYPDLLVMHPRRAAWLAVSLSDTVPLFQVGSLNQAAGQNTGGFVSNLMGLNVVQDASIPTTLGASTNEDVILVLASEDFILLESPPFARVNEFVGSGTGAIRFELFSHSAFLSKRYPKSATVISGTGLAAPTFA
jgi:Phage capsid family